MHTKAVILLVSLAAVCSSVSAQCRGTADRGGSCGAQSGLCCSDGQCCSKHGFCGESSDHCQAGCQAGFGRCGASGSSTPAPERQSTPRQPSGSGGGLLTAQQWESMFPNRNNPQCHGARNNFYSHSAFLTAAASFPAFATSSDATTNKRELAAFLAHISHETGGLCWIAEGGAGGPPADRYCQSGQYPCAPGKSYHGRGQLEVSARGQLEAQLELQLLQRWQGSRL